MKTFETEDERKERESNDLFKGAINRIKKDKEVNRSNVNIEASFAIMATVKAMIDAGYRVDGE